jgi:hypothetical protein
MVDEIGPLLDESGQISEFAKLHYDVHAGGRLVAIDKGDDVGVMQAAQDRDLRNEVVFELFVQLGDVDGFDGDGLAFLL